VLTFVATGSALGAPTPLSLDQRLIQSGEFPPFVSLPGQSTTQYDSPRQWTGVDTSLTAAQASAQVTRLRKEGFVAIVSRQLGTAQQEPWSALCWVMQLGSASAAKGELAANVQEAKTTSKPPDTYAAFTVSGIPGARGFYQSSPGGAGNNVEFADGPFLYLLGVGWTSKPQNTPTRAELVAASIRLYARVHGHPRT
jgi:hypothetical protein